MQVNEYRKCAKSNGHLSNKNVLSNFLKEFLLREESFNLAGRSFQTVGPETLNDLGPKVFLNDLKFQTCPPNSAFFSFSCGKRRKTFYANANVTNIVVNINFHKL